MFYVEGWKNRIAGCGSAAVEPLAWRMRDFNLLAHH
jgi:hypothetical protein